MTLLAWALIIVALLVGVFGVYLAIIAGGRTMTLEERIDELETALSTLEDEAYTKSDQMAAQDELEDALHELGVLPIMDEGPAPKPTEPKRGKSA